MKNAERFKKCILLTWEEFVVICENILKKPDDKLYIELSLDGICINYEDSTVTDDEVCSKLASYFGVDKVTSFHADDFENAGVWIAYE